MLVFVFCLLLMSCKSATTSTKSNHVVNIYQNMQKADTIFAVYEDSSVKPILANHDTALNVLNRTPDNKWLIVELEPVAGGKDQVVLFYVPQQKTVTNRVVGLSDDWFFDDFSDSSKINVTNGKTSEKKCLQLNEVISTF